MEIQSLTTKKESLLEDNNDKISVLANNVNDSQSKLASAKETIVSLQSNVQDVNNRMAEMTEEQTRLLELISSKVGHLLQPDSFSFFFLQVIHSIS